MNLTLDIPHPVCVGPAGMVYGTLHFITFDGTEYSFKALGEFVLTRISTSKGSNIFTLQGEAGLLHTQRPARQVPALVRLAAFHQGIGKVSVCVCDCVCVLGGGQGCGGVFLLNILFQNMSHSRQIGRAHV